MRAKTLLATLALSAVLFSGCNLKSNEAIITVNNKKITQGQFDDMFDKQTSGGMFKAMGIDVKDSKNVFIYMLVKERVVNELIVKALIDEEIAKRGITVTDKDVNEAVKGIIDKLGSKERLDEALKQNGITPAQFKSDLKEEVKMKMLANSLGSVEISDAEAKKFYNDNIDKFKLPDRVRASHILISVNPEEITEALKADKNNKSLDEDSLKAKVDEEIKAKETKAQSLLAEVKRDSSQFAKLAKENSDDKVSAEQGGDLGFFGEKEMVPEFAKAAFSSKPNTVYNGVVRTQYGYHIIMVTDRAAASTEPFEKVKSDIKAFLANQKEVELVDNLVESLKKNATIKYVNPDYDPDNIRKSVQENIKNQEEKDVK